jgi:hypothetical protein
MNPMRMGKTMERSMENLAKSDVLRVTRPYIGQTGGEV